MDDITWLKKLRSLQRSLSFSTDVKEMVPSWIMEFGSSVSVRKIRAKINILPTNKIFVKNMVGLKVLIAMEDLC